MYSASGLATPISRNGIEASTSCSADWRRNVSFMRLGRPGCHLEVELALEVVGVVVDPRLARHGDDAGNLLAGQELLHQPDDPLADAARQRLDLGQPVLGPSVGGVLDHRRLGGGALDLAGLGDHAGSR